MKLISLALFMGCSALVCKFAVQSELVRPEAPKLAAFPELRKILEHLRFAFPGIRPTPAEDAAAEAADRAPALRVIPSLPKAETLLLIAAAAERHNVPEAFVQSIVAAESNFDCAALSPKGAIGLMQLMPATARDFGADPAVPAENIDAGTRYLRWLMNRYKKNSSSMKRVIAAYNAGPGMVDRYRGVPPFRETRHYVTRVLSYMKQFEGARKRTGTRG